MKRVLGLSACIALAVAAASPVKAQILFDNGAPNNVNGYHSDFATDNPSDTVVIGDDFTFASAQTITGVDWYGLYAFSNVPPPADDFTIRIYDYSGPTPATNAFVSVNVGNPGRIDTGGNVAAFDVFLYQVSSLNIPLGAGRYLLSIVNNTPSHTASDWYWADTRETGGDGYERNVDTDPWIDHDEGQSVDWAFLLRGGNGQAAAPEPGSIALLLTGLASVGICLRRARR